MPIFRKVLCEHRLLRGRDGAGEHRPQPGAGAGDEQRACAASPVPGHLLHPGDYVVGGGRHDVAMALQHRLRADQYRAEAASACPTIPWLSSTAWAMPAVIIMAIWKNLGYNMVIYLAGLQGIPAHLLRGGRHRWRRRLASAFAT